MNEAWIEKHGIATKPGIYIMGFEDGYHESAPHEQMLRYEQYRDGWNDGYVRQLKEERDRLLSYHVRRKREARAD